MARDRCQRNSNTARPTAGVAGGRTMNTFVKIIRNGHMAPGKLADAELHFTGGELDGLRLIGFSIWARKDGTGQNVTFPARQFTAVAGRVRRGRGVPITIRTSDGCARSKRGSHIPCARSRKLWHSWTEGVL